MVGVGNEDCERSRMRISGLFFSTGTEALLQFCIWLTAFRIRVYWRAYLLCTFLGLAGRRLSLRCSNEHHQKP